MKIATTEWLTLAEACKLAGYPQASGYRVAKRLGLVETFFGVSCVRKRDVKTLEQNRRQPGNPNWIESGDAAAADGAQGTQARENKKARTRKR